MWTSFLRIITNYSEKKLTGMYTFTTSVSKRIKNSFDKKKNPAILCMQLLCRLKCLRGYRLGMCYLTPSASPLTYTPFT